MIDELSLCSNLEYIPEKCIDNYFIYIWRSLVGYLNELPAQSSIYNSPTKVDSMEYKQCLNLEIKLINIATCQLWRWEKLSEVNQVKYFTLSYNTRRILRKKRLNLMNENSPNLMYCKRTM